MKKSSDFPSENLILLIACLIFCLTPAAVHGQDNLVFILDASGSMWGQVEGKAKIVIAKEVLNEQIRDLPEGQNVGLVAYGHRRKGDCDDVEELVPVGKLNKQTCIDRINAINPKGKTPITRSIPLTAEKIKKLEQASSIIQVSDGKETCDPDPCGLVNEPRESGIEFVMHVIGFDVTEEEKKQLECIAKEGGGEYFTAENAGEFKKAAAKAIKSTTVPSGYLQITALANGKLSLKDDR